MGIQYAHFPDINIIFQIFWQNSSKGFLERTFCRQFLWWKFYCPYVGKTLTEANKRVFKESFYQDFTYNYRNLFSYTTSVLLGDE